MSEKAKAEKAEVKAAKSSAEIAAEARAAADAAEVDAQEFEQLAKEETAAQIEEAMVEARKVLETKQNALVRVTKEVDDATKALDALIVKLEVVRPPLSTMELIQKHLTEQTEKQRAALAAGKPLVNPIDQIAMTPANSPFQYRVSK